MVRRLPDLAGVGTRSRRRIGFVITTGGCARDWCLCQDQEWQRQMKAMLDRAYPAAGSQSSESPAAGQLASESEQSDSRMMDADELRNAVWAVLSTPNTSADEMVLALRGFLRSGSSEGESDS
jgi:hypothetical protein